jgi:PHD/YefM family antitoxin component YafN of YafNO toxin-antitoxin module
MANTKFLSMRELRSSTSQIREMLGDDGKIVVTNNGKPAALMLGVSEITLEEMLADIRRVQAKRALKELQMSAIQNGTASMTMEEINAEIASVHTEKITAGIAGNR